MARKKKKDKLENEELDNDDMDNEEIDDIDIEDQDDIEEDSKSKKGKKEKKEKKEKSGKGKKLLSILLIILLIGSLIGYIFMYNGFGLRDGMLRPVLENVPYVSERLPEVEDQSAKMGELVLENEGLIAENALLKQQVENADSIAESSVEEIERLKLIEEQQTEFVQMKEEFDKNFAEMTAEDYIAYYEAMYPDIAQEIFGELIIDKYNKEELDEYIATFQAMEASSIAAIFEEMMNTDIELVVLIIQNLDNKLAGDTLSAMDPVNAAQVAKLMSPDVR